jgi:uncharacterized protein
MDKATLAGFMDRRILELIILPTEQCNFRCTYCYEDFEIGQMQERTVDAIKALIMARLSGIKRLVLTWFGGEPLLGKAVVFDLCAFAQRECAKLDVQFSSNMTTNAFGLDRATFARLTELGMTKYQISLDGDEEVHNQTRKLMSGRGTFHKIWGNLLAMRESDAHFLVRMRLHVHKSNLDSVKILLKKINDAFGDDPRYFIFLKAVGNWGGESVRSMELLKESGSVIEEMQQMLRDWGWHAKRPYEQVEKKFLPCYAATPTSFVIRADGSLAKCTVAFNDARNRIGRLNDDGTLTIDNEKMRAFMRGFQEGDEEALHCPMHSMPAQQEVKVMQFSRNIESAAVAATAG